MSSTSDKAIVPPKWDGEAKTFKMWWMRFLAYTKVHKFREALKERLERFLPISDTMVLDPANDAHKPRIEAKKK